MQPTPIADAFFTRLDVLLADVHDDAQLSRDHCVDALLDLYNARPSPTVRTVISEVIAGLGDHPRVGAEEVYRIVALLVAAVTAEAASLRIGSS